MKKIKWKGGALVAPVPPAMITCGDMENSNIITVAWTGITNTVPPKTYISVRPSRHSYNIIKESGEFVINLTSKELVKSADYCGIYTGAKVNKFEKCSFERVPSETVAPPTIAGCPLALECRVTEVIPMGSHDVFMADILRITCHETLLDENGKIHMERANLLAYAHGEYYALGKRVGTFGFSAAKKKKHPPKGQKNAPKKK